MAITTGAIVARSCRVWIGTWDISGSSNMVAMRPAKDVQAYAAFGEDWEYHVASIKRYDGVFRAIYSETAAEAMTVLWSSFDSMIGTTFIVDPKGSTAANWRFSGTVQLTGAPIELERTGGVVVVECPFTGDGALTKGTVP